MKVSFDFDGTIANNKQLQKLARTLIHSGSEVFIITSRHFDNEKRVREVHEFAKKQGIKKSRIIFTPLEEKWKHVKRLKIDLHFDDDFVDVDQINTELPYRAMYVGYEMSQLKNDDTI